MGGQRGREQSCSEAWNSLLTVPFPHRLCSKHPCRPPGPPRAPASGMASSWRLLNANGACARRSRHDIALSAPCASRRACPSCPAGGGIQRTASLGHPPAAASKLCSGTQPYDGVGLSPKEPVPCASRAGHGAGLTAGSVVPCPWAPGLGLTRDHGLLGCCPLLGYGKNITPGETGQMAFWPRSRIKSSAGKTSMENPLPHLKDPLWKWLPPPHRWLLLKSGGKITSWNPLPSKPATSVPTTDP